MKLSRCDVVLVEFPFASGHARKLRPAVVVQSDTYNRKLQTTILAPITSNTRHSSEASQIAVDPATTDGASTGLLQPSAVKCENLATVEVRLVLRKIGVLSPSLRVALNRALQAALEISP